MKDSEEIIKQLEKRLTSFNIDTTAKNVGQVLKNTDGVIVASGLSKAMMSELVEFSNGSQGVVLNLDEDTVSIILLDKADDIEEGALVKTTGILLSIEVSEDILGRVVNPLGIPLDNKPKIKNGKKMPLERIAAGVVQREPVNTPIKTGIKAIDAMIPIGRGQRELIIGDRGIGKTAIAIDTIINQNKSTLPKALNLFIVFTLRSDKNKAQSPRLLKNLKKQERLNTQPPLWLRPQIRQPYNI
jgi:F-type H+-transporting ATPase subunit alpha